VSETQPERTHPEDRLGGAIDGALHLLDRQVIDADGRLCGKVDDVELTPTPDALQVTGFLSGPPALLERLGGRLGDRTVQAWRELKPPEPLRDHPWRIDVSDVERLDSALHLKVSRDGVLRKEKVDQELRLGSLLGTAVHLSHDGPREASGPPGPRIGQVLDARFVPGPAGFLELDSLLVGRGRPGGLLGYDRRGDQGPWLVRTVVRALHRHTVIADAGDAEIDWVARVVTLPAKPRERPDHPFA
jgi:hypothetical protein